MLLVADVGNTHVHLGLFRGERLLGKAKLTGEQVSDLDEHWPRFVASALPGGSTEADIAGACLCSVSPKIKVPLLHWLSARLGQRPKVIGDTLPYPLPVRVDEVSEVGADRVVNAFAAWKLLGEGPIVVCDFGTAITLDVVSEDGAYVGGMIAPGVNTQAKALSAQTALLPYVRVQPTDRAIGRNTMDAILAGLYFGLVGQVDAMCEAVVGELGKTPRFVATGGDAHLVVGRSRYLDRIEPDLTLEGLRLISRFGAGESATWG